MTVQPLRNEKRPLKPLQPWTQPPDTFKYKVKTGDTWLTLGALNHHQFGEHTSIWLNFRLSPLDHFYTDQVNWYLREYVGCRHSLDGGRNWAFTDDADPGYIFLPTLTYDMDAIAITGSRGLGGVSVPGYSDKTAFDTIGKALDIYNMADLGIGVLEIPVGALIEGGMIVVGPLVAAVGGPFALGAAWNVGLKKRTREHFFTAFCSTFVMTAAGWSAEKVDDFNPQWAYTPTESIFTEKAESFRKLHNFGLKVGRLQGSRLNTVDKRNLFTLLRSRLSDAEARDWNGDVNDWSLRKQRDYYERLASILKQIMLDNDLQVTFK
jgi:hypothetical protein